MTGTKASLKIVSTHRNHTFSGKAGCVTPTDSQASPKPKLLDQLREALRSRHYGRRTEQIYMIYTHVLNRVPTSVRSPADGLRRVLCRSV